MDPTSTHLPVFDLLFNHHRIKTVLEFGCGLFSTKKFTDEGCIVTSIEMQHKEWFDKVKSELPGVDLRLAIGKDTWESEPLNERYDLIFVDGHGDSRPECLMWAKNHTDLIVAHDTEHPYYEWHRADMSGFDKQLFDELTPTTTVWTKSV
jgi:predicted O-methyltransferase YrrM